MKKKSTKKGKRIITPTIKLEFNRIYKFDFTSRSGRKKISFVGEIREAAFKGEVTVVPFVNNFKPLLGGELL